MNSSGWPGLDNAETSELTVGRALWGKLPGSRKEYDWVCVSPVMQELFDHLGEPRAVLAMFPEPARRRDHAGVGRSLRIERIDDTLYALASFSEASQSATDASGRPIVFREFFALPLYGTQLRILPLIAYEMLRLGQSQLVSERSVAKYSDAAICPGYDPEAFGSAVQSLVARMDAAAKSDSRLGVEQTVERLLSSKRASVAIPIGENAMRSSELAGLLLPFDPQARARISVLCGVQELGQMELEELRSRWSIIFASDAVCQLLNKPLEHLQLSDRAQQVAAHLRRQRANPLESVFDRFFTSRKQLTVEAVTEIRETVKLYGYDACVGKPGPESDEVTKRITQRIHRFVEASTPDVRQQHAPFLLQAVWLAFFCNPTSEMYGHLKTIVGQIGYAESDLRTKTLLRLHAHVLPIASVPLLRDILLRTLTEAEFEDVVSSTLEYLTRYRTQSATQAEFCASLADRPDTHNSSLGPPLTGAPEAPRSATANRS